MSTAVAPRRNQQVQTQEAAPSAFEKAIMFGDISGLDERGRMEYTSELCKSLGLNPLGRAFEYIRFGGDKSPLTCYLTAMGASQLRKIHQVSILKVEDHGIVNGFYRMTITGGMPNGRTDIEFGAVYASDRDGKPFVGLALENVRKKTLTQSKSRITKSLVGLAGMPAEDERDDFGDRWGTGPTPESLAAQTINAPGSEAPKAKREWNDNDPAPAQAIAKWRYQATALREAGGEVIDVPDDLTVGGLIAVRKAIEAGQAAILATDDAEEGV